MLELACCYPQGCFSSCQGTCFAAFYLASWPHINPPCLAELEGPLAITGSGVCSPLSVVLSPVHRCSPLPVSGSFAQLGEWHPNGKSQTFRVNRSFRWVQPATESRNFFYSLPHWWSSVIKAWTFLERGSSWYHKQCTLRIAALVVWEFFIISCLILPLCSIHTWDWAQLLTNAE